MIFLPSKSIFELLFGFFLIILLLVLFYSIVNRKKNHDPFLTFSSLFVVFYILAEVSLLISYAQFSFEYLLAKIFFIIGSLSFLFALNLKK